MLSLVLYALSKSVVKHQKNPKLNISLFLSLVQFNTLKPGPTLQTLMWYLSRTPSSSSSSENPTHPSIQFSTNSIFPVSDDGLFTEICIVQLPNDSLFHRQTYHHHHTTTATKIKNGCQNPNTQKQVEEEDDEKYSFLNSWEWFAYICSPTQLRSVAIPRSPPSLFRIQVMAVLPEQFLCAKLPASASEGTYPAVLCTYSPNANSLHDVPQMYCPYRNLISSACAIVDGWLYVAGGINPNPDDPSYTEPSSTNLNSAERLNLRTWEWQTLPNMQKTRTYATGLAYKHSFYVVGGSADMKHSAEIYRPSSNSWLFIKSFVPEEAEGFSVAALSGRLLILTWSGHLGVKLWQWTVLANPNLICGCRLVSFFPDQLIERDRVKQYGARMVKIGEEVWVVVDENLKRHGEVGGSCAWPVFPAPMFRPSDEVEVVQKGYIHAFNFRNGLRLSWRKIPIFSILE